MVLVNPIQDTNHRTANQSQSSGFLVFSKYRTYGLLDFPKLVSVCGYQAAIE